MTKCLLFFAVSSVAYAACLPVTGNRILGRDLALADPQFSKLPASLTIGFAPDPGTRRIFSTTELERVARANGIPVANPADVCFEIPMLHLTQSEALAAMRRSLPAGAALKIVELEDVDVPSGITQFPIDGLGPPTAADKGVQLWRGHVQYAETRQASVWARVVITVTFTAVVAGADLPQDTPIGAGSLRIETRSGPLERDQPATRIEDVAGRMPKRELKAGSVIPISVLTTAPIVRRGDPVSVEVRSGMALLQFEAIAESAARDGDVIELRNPSSGKTFKARIDRGPKALLVLDSGRKL